MLLPHFLRALAYAHPSQATEYNEMSLLEGELVQQIEELDEGWWSGIGPGGKTGMFPANYVEIVEATPPGAAEPEPEAAAPLPPPPPPPPPPVSAFLGDVGNRLTDVACSRLPLPQRRRRARRHLSLNLSRRRMRVSLRSRCMSTSISSQFSFSPC